MRNPNAPIRVYCVGAHSTGKTTVARAISKQWKLPLISEVARSVLAERELSLETIRADIGAIDSYQLDVFRRQIEIESQTGDSFVSDRAFDNVAYAAEHATIAANIVESKAFADYMQSIRTGGIVFFLRPHHELLADDGVRAAVTWESVVRIDGMIKLLLEGYRIPYLSLDSRSHQERIRAVDLVLYHATSSVSGNDDCIDTGA